MIDTTATSAELGAGPPRPVFLPVGACEQHFDLLPINSDIIQSEALARALAGRFDGFLLPPLPFGTSLENTGAPGTVTLMPSTLTAVVRDIVEGLYLQGTELVVLVNSHGGNFALRPAVRELNYRNPGHKTIFVDPWEMVPPERMAQVFEGTNELHCGEHEVSVMLYLFPEMVRVENLRDGTPAAERRELDLFSLPSLTGGDPWGLASRATADKGRRYFELMIEYSAAFLERVIARHRERPSYHG